MAQDLASILLEDAQVDGSGKLVSVSQHDSNLKRLVSNLKDIHERELVTQFLDLLHPTQNTISYLFVLLAQKNISLKTRQLVPGLLDHTITFLASFDPVQARYVGQELRELIEWLARYYQESEDASIIPAIGAAILQLDPDSSTFTSTHLLFVRLCLAATLPRQALSILDKDIYNFPSTPIKNVDNRELCAPHQTSATYITKSSGLSADIAPADVQEYYLLGAHVYLGLRNWTRAKLFLELVLASPTSHVATPLMIEAYKKLILLGCLSTGKPFSVAGIVDQQAQKTISSLSKAYDALCQIFKSRDLQRFNAEVDAGAQLWADDGNTRLVALVAESLQRYRVVDLQKTYSALSVHRIAVSLDLSLESTMNLLSTMISDGHINAILSHPTTNDGAVRGPAPVLRFLSPHPNHGAIGFDQNLVRQERCQQIERLSRHVREADRKLAISKEYVEFMRRSKRAEGAGAPGYEDPMEETWDTPAGDADEDMMGDLR